MIEVLTFIIVLLIAFIIPLIAYTQYKLGYKKAREYYYLNDLAPESVAHKFVDTFNLLTAIQKKHGRMIWMTWTSLGTRYNGYMWDSNKLEIKIEPAPVKQIERKSIVVSS